MHSEQTPAACTHPRFSGQPVSTPEMRAKTKVVRLSSPTTAPPALALHMRCDTANAKSLQASRLITVRMACKFRILSHLINRAI